ncbi:MAG: lysophospholipid acyltransferase family protein [Acidimicrobiales bacterium]|jgi:1-acyl-sn-glycerol-3-phosphate acyltransferase
MSEDAFKLNPKKTPDYYVVATIVSSLSRLLFRPRVSGRENIPLEGPVLIAPIHRSNVDFAFTLFISPRKVFFMAKDGLFKVKWFGAILSHLGAFPINRSAATDRESMKAAEAVLDQGQALVLFPEGTRKEGRRVETLNDGAMFIAARTGATVVPVGIGGSDKAMPLGARFPRPARIRIIIGEPITPPTSTGRVSRSAITAKTEELRQALEAVYLESLKG